MGKKRSLDYDLIELILADIRVGAGSISAPPAKWHAAQCRLEDYDKYNHLEYLQALKFFNSERKPRKGNIGR